MIGQIKICQHNVAKGRDIIQSLFQLSLSKKSDVIFVQEPFDYFNSYIHSFITPTHPAYQLTLHHTTTGAKSRVSTNIYRISSFDISARTDLISDADM